MSLGWITCQVSSHGDPAGTLKFCADINLTMCSVHDADLLAVVSGLRGGLDDYSTDQRGDVGSWTRVAAIAALSRVISHVARQPTPHDRITAAMFNQVIGGMVKQGVEKLEPVRAEVWRAFCQLRTARAETIWPWEGSRTWDFDPGDRR